MTQEEVANRIGVTPQALSKWERNQSFPDITILSDLCFVLGVSADYLLGGEKPQIAENGDEKVQGGDMEQAKELSGAFGSNIWKRFSSGCDRKSIYRKNNGFAKKPVRRGNPNALGEGA